MQAMKKSSIWSKLLMAVLSVALVFTMMPLSMGTVYAEDEPVVFTIVGTDGNATEYTMAQMEAKAETTTATVGGKEIEGFILSDLLDSYDDNDTATVSTVDNYSDVNASGKTVGELKAGNYILAYREGDKELRNTEVKDKNTQEVYGIGNFYLFAGNGDRDKWVSKIVLTASADEEETPPADTVFTIVDVNGSSKYFTMEEMQTNVMHTTTTIGDTEVEGFIVKNLLKGYDENAVATVSTVDNYSDVNASGKTVSELRNNNYILAYREGDKNLRNTEVKDKKTGEVYGIGNFYLYAGNGDRDKWVNKIVLKSSDDPVDPPQPEPQGAYLTVTGNALKSELSFATFDELTNDSNIKANVLENVDFYWKNSKNSTGKATVTGITINDLIEIAGLKDNMEIKKIKATASDNWNKTYEADTLLEPDKDGNPAMYAWIYELWSDDGQEHKQNSQDQRIVYGQFTDGEMNQPGWGQKIIKLEVIGEETADEPETKPAPAAKVIPKAPKIKTQAKGAKSAMIVSWAKVKNATSYNVMYRKAGSKWATKSAKNTSLWVKGMKKGNLYEFKAVSVGKDGKSKASNVVYRYYKPAYSVKLTAKKKAVKVSWKKDAKASGYQVFYSTNKNMKNAKKVTVKGKKTKCTISKLTKGKKYYVKVRPYVAKNGHTYLGTLSMTKSVKAK